MRHRSGDLPKRYTLHIQLCETSLLALRKISQTEIFNNCNKEYNNYNNAWLKKFIPTIDQTIHLISISLKIPQVGCFVTTWYGPFRNYLKKLILTNSQHCLCGADFQHPNHFLLDCNIIERILKVRKLPARRKAIWIGEIIRRDEGLHIFKIACCKIAKLALAINKELNGQKD